MTALSLADSDWLAQHRDDPALVVLDIRPAADYWAGHLEGARHLDAGVLALPSTDAPAIARFHALLAQLLSGLGITRQSRVLVTGAAGEVNVSRVAWALAYAGLEQVALLDGGLAALPAPALVQAAPAVAATHFVPQPVASLLATAQQAQALSEGQAAGVLVDARERVEYLGQRSNARRNGRIPGARHWDTAREIDDAGRFRPTGELAAGLASLGAPDDRLVAYCGGGGRAARTFVALQLAGYRNVAVYPASWNEWGNRDELPIETGEPRQATA